MTVTRAALAARSSTCACACALAADGLLQPLGARQQQLLRLVASLQLRRAAHQLLDRAPDDVTDVVRRVDLQQVLKRGKKGDLLRRVAHLQAP